MNNLYLLDIDTQGIDRSVCRSLVSPECVQHVFKVRGENHMVAVIKGDVDEHVDRLAECKVYKVSCTPLMPYEQFASQIFEISGRVDSEREKKGKAAPFVQGQDIYWLRFSIGYKGRTLEELLKAWCDEAAVALGLIRGGQVPIALYKSVAMREVHLFVQVDGSAQDKTCFGLPIMKALGDEIDIVTKAVRVM